MAIKTRGYLGDLWDIYDTIMKNGISDVQDDFDLLYGTLKKDFKQNRMDIVREWYKVAPFNIPHIFKSLEFNQRITVNFWDLGINEELPKGTELGSVRMKFDSWINTEKYCESIPSQKAEAWMKRRMEDTGEGHVDKIMEAGEFILKIQLEEGIIGLPPETRVRTDIKWINPNPIVQIPFNTYNELHPSWITFVDDAMKKCNFKIINKL